MSYDEGLVERIREALEERSDVSEKKMSDADLRRWVIRGVDFASSLPPK
jgi:hypothetical protein